MNIISHVYKPSLILWYSIRIIHIHHCDRRIHPKSLISLPINRCRMDLVLPLGIENRKINPNGTVPKKRSMVQ